MRKLALKAEHYQKLAECGLQDVPAGACQCLCFEPGETVTREGEALAHFALVISGRAKVCRTAANGKSLILCYYISGGVAGDVELLSYSDRATATLMAISPLECVMIDYRYCKAELNTNPVFLRCLGVALAEKLVASTDNLALSALYTGEQRLCSYILQNANRGVFSAVLTDVACSVGVSYRHLLRMLSLLCMEDILEKRESGYFIKNHEELLHRSCKADRMQGDAQ